LTCTLRRVSANHTRELPTMAAMLLSRFRRGYKYLWRFSQKITFTN